jgi:DNA-binding NarL/FixJ family response regulator
MSKIRILLADDHMLMRMGIATLVSTAKDMTVVGEACNGRQAVELAGSLRPDVVIMDLMMPEMSGGEATKAIHAAHPGIKIVILTTYGTSAELATAVTNGAVGVLLKDKVEMDLLNTIRFVVEGNQVIPTRLLAQIEEDKAMGKLTDRQMEILASVAEGQSNADIALQFGLSEITVKKHLSAIFERLGVANRSEAVALAFRKQMLKA